MEPTFPLFRLSENVIVQVFQNTDPKELLIISFVSKKTKNLVTSLGLRALKVFIGISRVISLNVNIGRLEHFSSWNLIFRNDSNDRNAEFDITRPVSASYQSQDKPFQPSTPFNFSDWLNHIQTVFCNSEPLEVFLWQGSERFELESLKNTMKNVKCLTITPGVADIQSNKILKSFKDLNGLTLRSNPFEDTCEVQKFFIQNFGKIRFHDTHSLDDMLLVNSEKSHILSPVNSETIQSIRQALDPWIESKTSRRVSINR